MHVVAPEEASTCRSKGPKDEWIDRTLIIIQMVEDFESRPHKLCFFVEGEKGMERAEAAEGAAWLQWRKVARKEYKEKGREEGAVDEDGERSGVK